METGGLTLKDLILRWLLAHSVQDPDGDLYIPPSELRKIIDELRGKEDKLEVK